MRLKFTTSATRSIRINATRDVTLQSALPGSRRLSRPSYLGTQKECGPASPAHRRLGTGHQARSRVGRRVGTHDRLTLDADSLNNM